MISKTTVLLAAATCLSVTAGLFAPDVICDMQSRIDGGTSEAFETTQITLEPSSHASVLEALKLNRDSSVFYEMEDGANLTAEEAVASALDATKQLAQAGFGEAFEGAGVRSYTVPYLYVDQDQSASGIIWGCELSVDGEESTAYLYVDDATGKVVSYVATIYHPLEGSESDGALVDAVRRPTLEDVQRWLATCQDYWGLGLELDSFSVPADNDEVFDSMTMNGSYAVENGSYALQDEVSREKEAAEALGIDEGAKEAAARAAEADEGNAPVVLNGSSAGAPEDDRLFEKLVSKHLATGDTMGLMELYDGLDVNAYAAVSEDPDLTVVLDWRFGVNFDSIYEIWTMMPV